jgi:hypothetical protein
MKTTKDLIQEIITRRSMKVKTIYFFYKDFSVSCSNEKVIEHLENYYVEHLEKHKLLYVDYFKQLDVICKEALASEDVREKYYNLFMMNVY